MATGDRIKGDRIKIEFMTEAQLDEWERCGIDLRTPIFSLGEGGRPVDVRGRQPTDREIQDAKNLIAQTGA